MLLDLLWILSLVYAGQMLLFAVAAWRSRYSTLPEYHPRVSIVVAARDEEANLSRCLRSLEAVAYPRELLEIIVVDDRSTDGTCDIVREFATRNASIRLVQALPGTGQLQGKANAVTQGIEVSTGEIILFTDADCMVQPGWVQKTVRYYDDESVGLVAGFTELRASTDFQRMQSLDWFLLFSVAAAGIRLRHPFTAVGNNLSVRRAAYDAVGGFRKIPFSVTEDYALFHAVTEEGRYRARFPLDRETLVISQPCSTLEQLYHQKKRWFTGGRGMEPRILSFFVVSYVYNFLMLFGIPWMFAAGFWLPWAIKAAVDLALLVPALKEFRRWELLRAFPHFQLYFLLYVVFYPPIVLFGKGVVWKEQTFR